MTQIKSVSDRVKVEKMSLYRDHKLQTKFLPKIIVDGEEACIADNSSSSVVLECDTREEAWIKAIEHRDRAKARLTVKEV